MTSAIGPYTAPRCETPVRRDLRDFLDTPIAEPASLFEVRDGRVPVLHRDQAALERLAIPSCRRAC